MSSTTSTVEHIEMTAKILLYKLLIIRANRCGCLQRLPVLLELLRFFPPLTYMGESWEVSVNIDKKETKTLFEVSLEKGQTTYVGTAD